MNSPLLKDPKNRFFYCKKLNCTLLKSACARRQCIQVYGKTNNSLFNTPRRIGEADMVISEISKKIVEECANCEQGKKNLEEFPNQQPIRLCRRFVKIKQK